VPTTQLGREASMVTRFLMHYVIPLLPFTTNVVTSAKFITAVCTSPELEGRSGLYFTVQKGLVPTASSEESQDVLKANKLWNWSCEKTGLNEFNLPDA
jgi:hypothetical protein